MTNRNTAFLLVLSMAFLPAGCEKEKPPPPAVAAGKVVVAASIQPIADLVKQIGGSRAEVRCILEPGRWPRGLDPGQVSASPYDGASLLFFVGMGMDNWALLDTIVRQANPSAKAIDLSLDPDFLRTYEIYMGSRAVAALRQPASFPSPRGRGHGVPSTSQADIGEANLRHVPPASLASSLPASVPTSPPTSVPTSMSASAASAPEDWLPGPDEAVWLDPVFMQCFAVAVMGELEQADPAGERDFARDADSCFQDLSALDREYKQGLAGAVRESNCNYLLTSRPTFGFLARRYGLRQIALCADGESAASPQRLDEVRGIIKAGRIHAVFTQPQFPSDQLEALAKELGLAVIRLDAVGNAYEPGYDTYQAMMRSNLRALTEGLRKGG